MQYNAPVQSITIIKKTPLKPTHWYSILLNFTDEKGWSSATQSNKLCKLITAFSKLRKLGLMSSKSQL